MTDLNGALPALVDSRDHLSERVTALFAGGEPFSVERSSTTLRLTRNSSPENGVEQPLTAFEEWLDEVAAGGASGYLIAEWGDAVTILAYSNAPLEYSKFVARLRPTGFYEVTRGENGMPVGSLVLERDGWVGVERKMPLSPLVRTAPFANPQDALVALLRETALITPAS